MRKEPGNIANIMVAGIVILAMTVVMTAFLDDLQLVQKKMEIHQIARRYILRMETVGYLQSEDRNTMLEELDQLGVTGVELEGTTVTEAGYGGRIVLEITGLLGGRYEFTEKRVSTAKY